MENTVAKKKVLVVDDIEMNRKILSVILSDQYEILEAENGLSAKKVLRVHNDIALILLDIIMPVMDGFAFLKYLLGNDQHKDIPVIFVTSETYEENVLEGIKMGVRDVIAKPYNPELILRRVNNLILLSESMEAESTKNDSAKVNSGKEKNVPRTVLIVDDIGINRVIIRSSLESGYSILEAADGKEALEIIQAHEQDIAAVLLDIIMPVMDGYEMMREANRRKLLKNIPVIAITSEDSIPKLNRILGLGICEIIQKPFTPSVVRNRVDYMVKLAQTK